ncbi:GMC oxidoreductase [Favolaschia claudopus]|uniref:GMC oxidoreductase n=1 Tax=Favolaschia claudopus TaxID=2862362 RepID=A0AAW0DHA5_9AGAR
MPFHYVVVGGGTAGLVLAARLVENFPDVNVCVLEAGENVTHEPDLVIPGFAFKNLGQPRLDWGFMSTPQEYAKGRSIYIPRGKALGGTSMINLMTMGRAHKHEYDAFAALGSPGWDWNGLVDYFRASETFAPSEEEKSKLNVAFNKTAHGTSGPIQRTLPQWISDVQGPFTQGMQSLGVAWNNDATSGNNVGLCTSYHSIDSHGARSSSASAYYEPNEHKANLTVVTGARATRILFDESKDSSGNLVASGVEYLKDGELHTASAQLEVLLCAGTIQTPQILELSGIGEKKILEACGVALKVELPGVGNNLQDHFWSPFVTETDTKYESVEIMSDPARAAREWKIYEESKKGMLSGTCSTLYAFLPKNNFMDSVPKTGHSSMNPSLHAVQKEWLAADDIPFLEVALFPGCLPVPGLKPEPGKSYCSVFLALTHSFSSGSIHITSSDPLAAPAIDYRLLDNEVDLDILVHAIKFARKLGTTTSLSSVFTQEIVPGPSVQTDEEIKEFIRSSIDTVFHPIGTAAMLPREKGGVVNSSLKVYGTSNLRVVDASIIPIHLSAHVQATVYAIAEKAAAIIAHDHQL